jgi:phage terminase large subunit-like protein
MMNPTDNKTNLNDSYIQMLEGLSGAKRRRFLLGEYGTEDNGSMWRREWFRYAKPPQTLKRVCVGVDPSGSVNGDAVGIVVAGIDNDNKYYILGDYSMHGTPEEWGNEIARVYELHQADIVFAERNFGGDMVASVITNMSTRNVNTELVTASRGKAVRAEPISAMYERSEVFHSFPMTELEDELCCWKPGDADSPNILDACVWALTGLSEERGGSLDYV